MRSFGTSKVLLRDFFRPQRPNDRSRLTVGDYWTVIVPDIAVPCWEQ